jgi:GNAT superfamily N-acetyltransferase
MEDDTTQVDPEDVILTKGTLGYNILLNGEYVGAIEGFPGKMEMIEVELHLQDKGIGRAAVNEFIALSQAHGVSEVTTNNVMHPAMEHILESEGFEKRSEEMGWVKSIQSY